MTMMPNPANYLSRKDLVGQGPHMLEDAFPGDWNDRCPDVACHTIAVLKEYGLTGFRIVAGRVEVTVTDPPLVLFAGMYTGTGKSEYHTWVVGTSRETLDFSIVP